MHSIFKDFDDESKHYFIAKDIAEHIDIAIDEIKELKGYHDIVNIEVIFDEPHKTRIVVSFINIEDDTYSWDFTCNYHLHFIDSVPKVLFWWIKKWKQVVQCEMGDIVGFYF